jgi:hypothetical protein
MKVLLYLMNSNGTRLYSSEGCTREGDRRVD